MAVNRKLLERMAERLGYNEKYSTTPGIDTIAKAYQNDPKTRLALTALAQGSDTSPVAEGGWGYVDGIARMLSGVAGGAMTNAQNTKYGQQEVLELKRREAADAEAQARLAAYEKKGGATPTPQQPVHQPVQPAPIPPAQALPQQAIPPEASQTAPQGQAVDAVAMALNEGRGPPAPLPGARAAIPPQAGGGPMGQPPFPATRGSGGSGGSFDLSAGRNALKALGANVTSGFRTPAKNASVDGVADSYHMRGDPAHPQAYDFTPPAGRSMKWMEIQARREYPGWDVINEGDHIHVEPSPAMVRAARSGAGTGQSADAAQSGPVLSAEEADALPLAGTGPQAAPAIDPFSAPIPEAVPELPPPAARPTRPTAVAARRSELLEGARALMRTGSKWSADRAADMYAAGLQEQGRFNEAAAGREQKLIDEEYGTDLGIFKSSAERREAADIAKRVAAVNRNEDREDEYVKWKREAAEKELDRRARVEEAQQRAAADMAVAGMRPGRPLPTSALNKLVAEAGALDAMEFLNTNFKDSYVGRVPGVGGAEVALNKVVGFNKDEADWWQTYQQWQTDLRHSKFGAALTPTEKALFEKYNIQPSTNKETARRNLAKQQAIISVALGRYARTQAMQYDPAIIEEAIGRDPMGLPQVYDPAPDGTGGAGKPAAGSGGTPRGGVDQRTWDNMTAAERALF